MFIESKSASFRCIGINSSAQRNNATSCYVGTSCLIYLNLGTIGFRALYLVAFVLLSLGAHTAVHSLQYVFNSTNMVHKSNSRILGTSLTTRNMFNLTPIWGHLNRILDPVVGNHLLSLCPFTFKLD